MGVSAVSHELVLEVLAKPVKLERETFVELPVTWIEKSYFAVPAPVFKSRTGMNL
jgi:hypothetical protein